MKKTYVARYEMNIKNVSCDSNNEAVKVLVIPVLLGMKKHDLIQTEWPLNVICVY